MKLTFLITRATAILVAASLISQAESWEVYPQGNFFPWILGVDPNGSVAYISDGASLRRGEAQGTLWSAANTPPLPTGYSSLGVRSLAVTSTGLLYLAGGTRNNVTGGRTFDLWESPDGALTWQKVYTAPYTPPITEAAIGATACDAAGNIYFSIHHLPGSPTGGYASTLTYYRIRKGTRNPQTGALSWTLLDDFPTSDKYSYNAPFLTIRPGNSSTPAEIWAAGSGINASTFKNPFLYARRSLDGGLTWKTANAWTVPSGYTLSGGSKAVAGADVNGVAYVTGCYDKKSGKSVQPYWLTFRSLDHGTTWNLVDTVPVKTSPSNFAADIFGGVFISGGGTLRAGLNSGTTWVSPDLPYSEAVAANLVGDVFVTGSGQGYTDEGYVYRLPANAP